MATALVIGTMIGSWIFLLPSALADALVTGATGALVVPEPAPVGPRQ
jgi:hypothetical protein